MPRETNIQIRRGSASDWASVNPTLASGEMAIENDTRKVKVGDGTTAWNELRYLGADGGDLDSGGGGELGYLVSGSNVSDVNGTYCQQGDHNGFPLFKNKNTNMYIFYYTNNGYNSYIIESDYLMTGYPSLYSLEPSTNDPNNFSSYSWFDELATAGAITVTETTC